MKMCLQRKIKMELVSQYRAETNVITLSLQFRISLQYQFKGLWLVLLGPGIKALGFCLVWGFFYSRRHIKKLSEIFQLEMFCITYVSQAGVCYLCWKTM